MNKLYLEVPEEIEYISEWKEYNIPLGKSIVDKGITGCGYTEYCLTNNDNIILCSPRRLLLKNKVEQHLQDDNILYLENKFSNSQADFDSSERDKVDRLKEKDAATIAANYTVIRDDFAMRVKNHILHCTLAKKPVKLLVTYDSFKYIYQFLGPERIKDFKVIIDEFQSIFTDSSFKADTELEFSEYINDCPNVCYLSATPMLEEYLDLLEEFQNLDMYVLVWKNHTQKAGVIRKMVSSGFQSIKKVVQKFLDGKYPQKVLSDKSVKISKEAVIYINSVSDIISLIGSCKLTPQNTDVICADTDKNRRKLKKIGFTISKPNIYENRHLNKMFTLCTRTVYLGADFYSDNATTWVVSNPNKENLAIDIALDLPQILGRQRMSENPWKTECTMFYQLSKDLQTDEQIKAIIEKKLLFTDSLLVNYDDVNPITQEALLNKYKRAADYKTDYVGVSLKTNTPKLNKLVLVSETRFMQVTKQDYIDNINVKRAIENQGYEDQYLEEKEDRDVKSLTIFITSPFGSFEEKMKAYCEFCDTHEESYIYALDYKIGTKNFNNYYTCFGTDVIKGRFSYKEAPMRRELENKFIIQAGKLNREITRVFKVGEKYTFKVIKEKLRDIYNFLGIIQKPKASVLETYFEVKSIRYVDPITKKRENGYKIIAIK